VDLSWRKFAGIEDLVYEYSKNAGGAGRKDPLFKSCFQFKDAGQTASPR